MECLTIGSSEDLSYIKESLINALPPNSIQSITVEPKQTNAEKMHFLDICFSKSKKIESDSDVPDGLDSWMAKWIRQKYESRILRQIIMSNYGCFSKQEQAKIFRIVLDNRKKEKDNSVELKMIQTRLAEYLQTSDKLYLDGFVRFRLREYWNELESVVEEGVDEFLLQREYDEFIDLLKFFVEIQTPQIDFLHIISQPDGKYQFLDESEKDITRDCIAEFLADLLSEEITYGDMLISVLIILAPQKILWHAVQHETNKELIQTAKLIFEDKLTLCRSCNFCKK